MQALSFHQLHQIDSSQLAAEAMAGLASQPARVSPKFLYDALGSRLFDAITELEEYYPTRTEAAIFTQWLPEMAAAIARAAGAHPTLVDLGAGNCAKAARLFDALAPKRYVAVDISVDFLRQSLASLQRQYPQMEMVGVGLDFSARLALPATLCEGPALVFYPGSSIGNFSPAEALHLLREARMLAAGGALLIGVDLVKPTAILEAAYADALGVTAAFNLNILRQLNRLIGSDFDPAQWQHIGLYNPAESRIEMHLEARCDVPVCWPGGTREFAAGERLHTENSCKYTVEGFGELLQQAGFDAPAYWTDSQGWFAVFWAPA